MFDKINNPLVKPASPAPRPENQKNSEEDQKN